MDGLREARGEERTAAPVMCCAVRILAGHLQYGTRACDA